MLASTKTCNITFYILVQITSRKDYDIVLYFFTSNISLSFNSTTNYISASADASGDESEDKYSEMSAIIGFLGHIKPPYPSL